MNRHSIGGISKMKYQNSFNPEGKTEIKDKAYLNMVGHFPKVGKKKTIPIELNEYWVSDENPDDTYGSIRTIGRVSLVDDTIYYLKELQSDSPHYGVSSNDRRWDCFIYVYGYSNFDKNTYINATIEKVRNTANRGWRYSFKIDDIIYGGDRIDLEGKYEAPYFNTYPYAKNQYQSLQRIIKDANRVLGDRPKIIQRRLSHQPQQSKEKKSKKPFQIPIIGGLIALASAWYFKNK